MAVEVSATTSTSESTTTAAATSADASLTSSAQPTDQSTATPLAGVSDSQDSGALESSQDDAGGQEGQDAGDAGDAGDVADDGRTLYDYLNPQATGDQAPRQTSDATMGTRPNQPAAAAQVPEDLAALASAFTEEFGERAGGVVSELTKRIAAMEQKLTQQGQTTQALSQQAQQLQIAQRQKAEVETNKTFDGFNHPRYGTSWSKATPEQRTNRAKDMRLAYTIQMGEAQNGNRVSDADALKMAMNIRTNGKSETLQSLEGRVKQAANRSGIAPASRTAPPSKSGNIESEAAARIDRFLAASRGT